MAGDMSNYLENAVANSSLRAVAFSAPAKTYISLHTADPGETGASNEIADGWYARKDADTAASGQSTAWDAASDGMCANSQVITFAALTGASRTITHVAIWDAVSGGNCLYKAALTASKTLNAGDVLSFAVGAITVTVS